MEALPQLGSLRRRSFPGPVGGCLPHAGEGSTRFLAAPPRARLLSEDPGLRLCGVHQEAASSPHWATSADASSASG